MLGAYVIIIPQSTQNWKQLLRIVQALAELLRGRVRLANFSSSVAFHGKQRGSHGDQHVYFSLETLRGLGERLEQRQSLTEMGNSFNMRGTLDGSLTSLVPI